MGLVSCVDTKQPLQREKRCCVVDVFRCRILMSSVSQVAQGEGHHCCHHHPFLRISTGQCWNIRPCLLERNVSGPVVMADWLEVATRAGRQGGVGGGAGTRWRWRPRNRWRWQASTTPIRTRSRRSWSPSTSSASPACSAARCTTPTSAGACRACCRQAPRRLGHPATPLTHTPVPV